MGLRRVVVALAVVVLAVTATVASAGANHGSRAPELSLLASFGTLGSGSTVGPDGKLYVTDGAGGTVQRIDPRTGAVSTYAEGLPTKVIDIGGAMDVAFIGHTAYVLVTLVGSDVGGSSTVGIYRLNGNGTFTVFADIGTWAIDNPPDTLFAVPTGVQYSIQTYHGGFLVTDGHHNRVLRVTRSGEISQLIAFGNIVPTGLEVVGPKVFMGQAGPVPHEPTTGKVVSFWTLWPSVRDVAQGAPLITDVELGPAFRLFALSQGVWDGVAEGSPALPDTGRLVKVTRHGTFTAVRDGSGQEIELDRPTSLEFIGNTGYVVSLSGSIYKVTNVS